MDGAHDFLKALAIVLCVAAVTTVAFHKVRQPVVLGYILAGFIIGPHVPVPLVADPSIVSTLSELGVILVMFSLGLEFNLRKLLRIAPTSGVTAVIECGLMTWLGFVVGRAFGWTTLESLFTGAIIAIASTTIIAKAFDEQGVRGALRDTVLGILIAEDLIAIMLVATLTALSTGAGLSAKALAVTTGRLALFLVAMVAVGLFTIPRAMRYVLRMKRSETTLVASIGICFAVALVAREAGYSVALGAFLAGSLVAESGGARTVAHGVEPVRDVFAAIFFVSVGMLIDPALIAAHWLAVVVLTLAVLCGKVVSVTLGAFLTGTGMRTSLQAGLTLAQIGEFSFIIAGVGLSLDATRSFLYPVAVAVSAITALSTPWLIRISGPVAAAVDARLPAPLQTFTTLYGTWIEGLKRARGGTSGGVGRLAGWLLADSVCLALLVVGTSFWLNPLAKLLDARPWAIRGASRWVILATAVAIAIPFSLGIVRGARRLGVALAARALPISPKSSIDPAAAPRRALVVTMQLASLLAVGVPLVAFTQPFLPGFQGAAALLVAVVVLGVSFWRSATNLEGHVRAGAEAIVEALAAQAGEEPAVSEDELAELRELLPGIGEPVPVRLPTDSPAVGKTLAQINLRGVTGATVLALRRGEQGVLIPTASEALQAGDVLALAGTRDATDAARLLLVGGATGG